jgi:hypothetical protein
MSRKLFIRKQFRSVRILHTTWAFKNPVIFTDCDKLKFSIYAFRIMGMVNPMTKCTARRRIDGRGNFSRNYNFFSFNSWVWDRNGRN